jgi:hypothetical protein
MEETINPTPEYIRGFNEGYLLAKESTELSDKLSSIKGESDRTKGFQDGRRQFVLDKAQEHRKNRSLSSRVNERSDRSKDRDHDIEKE